MWRRIVTVLAVCLLAVGVLPPGAQAAAALPAVYLALGDSLAVGVGATDPAQEGYVPRLFRSFQGGAVVDQLVNLGVGGETSASLIKGGQLGTAVAQILDKETDVRVVTLDIGGNDLLALLQPDAPCAADPQDPACQAAVQARLQAFARNYALILSTLQAALRHDPGQETVLVMTYYNHASGVGGVFATVETVIDQALLGQDGAVACRANVGHPERVGLNDLITCLAAPSRARVADVYPAFKNQAAQLTHVLDPATPGDFHPTDAGYEIIASVFLDAFPSANAGQ
jgi:lysophospholipase L1-like esterase